MKKGLILCLIAIFLVSVSGCVSKSKHKELSEQKTALERKCEELTNKEAVLRDEIAARQKEVTDLKKELRDAKVKINELDKALLQFKEAENFNKPQ